MSQLEVDKIIPQSGTTLTIGDSGDTITIASGATLSGSLNADNLDSGTVPSARLGTITNFTSTGIDDNATSTAITIDSAENVGIGIVNPSQKLHVEGAGSTYAKIKSTNAGTGTGLFFQNATGNYLIGAGAVSGGSELAFYDSTNSAERMRVQANGAVLIGATLSGSATAGDLVVNGGAFLGGTAAANKLDDYEEGTFTPGIEGTTTAGTFTPNNSYTRGRYTKVGRLVQVYFGLVYSSFTGTGNIRLTGLPFASENTFMELTTSFVNAVSINKPTDSVIYGILDANSTKIRLHTMSTVSTSRPALAVDGAGELYFSINYHIG